MTMEMEIIIEFIAMIKDKYGYLFSTTLTDKEICDRLTEKYDKKIGENFTYLFFDGDILEILIEDGDIITKYCGKLPINDICKIEFNKDNLSIYHSVRINGNGMVNVKCMRIPYKDIDDICF